jgi:dUTP pyrophosphatase
MEFKKVSFEEYIKQYEDIREIEDIREEWENIKLPSRATELSAGYDFFAPFPFKLSNNPDSPYPQTIKFGTGIRALIDEDKVLLCYPRSGQGFKYKLQLYNTVGVIDADYAESDNEGHIFVKLTVDSEELTDVEIPKGTGFMQGIIHQYFIVDGDNTTHKRNGGFGSTTDAKIQERLCKII